MAASKSKLAGTIHVLGVRSETKSLG